MARPKARGAPARANGEHVVAGPPEPADSSQDAAQVSICDEGFHRDNPTDRSRATVRCPATLAPMALTGTVLDTPERCESHRSAWDALAVAEDHPFCAPAWMLAWWRHVPGPRAALRVIVVHDGDDLVAIAPFYAERKPGRPTRYRILGAGTSHRSEPLAKAQFRDEAARVIAQELAGAEPRPALICFESVDMRSGWPAQLVESWPVGPRPWSSREWSGPAPTISLGGLTFDDWHKTKSRNFRSQSGRLRRRLEARGAQFHIAAD